MMKLVRSILALSVSQNEKSSGYPLQTGGMRTNSFCENGEEKLNSRFFIRF
jgi:hypothetical protein